MGGVDIAGRLGILRRKGFTKLDGRRSVVDDREGSLSVRLAPLSTRPSIRRIERKAKTRT